MAKGFKCGAGGGGSDLLLAVNAYDTPGAIPATAAENTVAVITTTPLSSWTFSPTEPEAPEEGMGWAVVGLTGKLVFNALKKNGVILYPVSFRQYINGAWADKPAKIFQRGVWVDWWIEGTLYDRGTSDDELTGGWASYAYDVASGYAKKVGEIEYNSDHMAMTLKGTSDYQSTFFSTVNALDLSGISSVEFTIDDATSTTGGMVKISVYTESGGLQKDGDILRGADGTVTKTGSVDVSGFGGPTLYRVGLMVWAGGRGSVTTVKLAHAALKE